MAEPQVRMLLRFVTGSRAGQVVTLGDRPISNVLHLLESKGVRLASLNHAYDDIDAFCLYRDDVPYVFLNTSKPTLYRLLKQGDIKGLKAGRQWRFRKSDLIAYMERTPVAVVSAPTDALDAELDFLTQEMLRVGAKPPEPVGPTVRFPPQEATRSAIPARPRPDPATRLPGLAAALPLPLCRGGSSRRGPESATLTVM